MSLDTYIVEKHDGSTHPTLAENITEAIIRALNAAVVNNESKSIKSMTNTNTGRKYTDINLSYKQV